MNDKRQTMRKDKASEEDSSSQLQLPFAPGVAEIGYHQIAEVGADGILLVVAT